MRDDDDDVEAFADQLEAKTTELEAGRKARRLLALQDTARRRDESARRALRRLDDLARWRTRLSRRAQRLRDGREWSQPVLTSVLKATFRLSLLIWLAAAVIAGSVRLALGLAPLVVLWIALVVELRR